MKSCHLVAVDGLALLFQATPASAYSTSTLIADGIMFWSTARLPCGCDTISTFDTYQEDIQIDTIGQTGARGLKKQCSKDKHWSVTFNNMKDVLLTYGGVTKTYRTTNRKEGTVQEGAALVLGLPLQDNFDPYQHVHFHSFKF
ncbi:hypothetical protein BGZ81_004614 [Podila clonocystis]|nr:hypothetical protein BGZ81_004614 [Podila clonocystis]